LNEPLSSDKRRASKGDTEMRNLLGLSLILIVCLLLLLFRSQIAEPAGQQPIRIEKASCVTEERRFVDNGDDTVTDTMWRVMWQKGDSGKELTFDQAQEYCKSLRLGGYADWRLPKAGEQDTAVAVELLMPRHSNAVYARFDLYWSSDPKVLLPFNYHPSYGAEVARIYPAYEGQRAFARAVRLLKTPKPDNVR
jgi:hypothetical protein